MSSQRENIEQRVKRFDEKTDYWITPEDALRDLNIMLGTLADAGRRYPLDPEEMIIQRDRLAEVMATVRRAQKRFEGFTRVVTLPGPIA